MIQRYSREVNRDMCSSGTPLPYCSNSNVGKAVEDCMRAIIGVLLNLTHDNGKYKDQDVLQNKPYIWTVKGCTVKVTLYK